MDFQKILNQVLGSVQQNSHSKQGMLGKLGGSAAAAGLASMLLKRKGGGSLMKAGTMAALGALAYQAYQTWQQNQNTKPQNAAGTVSGSTVQQLAQNAFEPQGSAAADMGRIILKTMIAAAAADGSIDETERDLIVQESGDDAETRDWLLNEARNPATVESLAQAIGSNTVLAAEAYLAARMVCGELSRKEIVFLSQLSAALQLDEKLVEQLEKQAGF